MSDLISRQDVMSRLQDFCDWCKDGRLQGAEFVLDCLIPNIPSAESTGAMDEAIQHYLEDGYMMPTGWIPCSERLPSEKGNYLIWYRFYDVIKAKTMSVCKIAYYSTELEHWLGLRYSEYSRDEVLAWMPLPTPYGGESDE